MQINLSSDGYEIVDSGHVFLFDENKDLKLDITADNGFSFSVVMIFLKDSSGKQEIRQEVQGNTLHLSCMNFRDKGTGLIAPKKIAEIEDRGLFLMFWSSLHGDMNGRVRSVRYTLFYETPSRESE